MQCDWLYLQNITFFAVPSFLIFGGPAYEFLINGFLVNKHGEIRRSSHPDVFCIKKCSLRFRKIHRKHLCKSLFFNKVAGLSVYLYQKRDSDTGIFPRIFRNVLRALFFQNTYGCCFRIQFLQQSSTPLKHQLIMVLVITFGTVYF